MAVCFKLRPEALKIFVSQFFLVFLVVVSSNIFYYSREQGWAATKRSTPARPRAARVVSGAERACQRVARESYDFFVEQKGKRARSDL